MTDALLVKIEQTTKEFARELKAGGPDVRLLQESVTEPIVCDFTNVNTLLGTPQMREAAEPVREQPPASSLRSRAYANYTLNDAVDFDLASQTFRGVVSAVNLPVQTQKLDLFSPIGVFDSILTKGTDQALTVNQTGYYCIVINLNIAFYPTGLAAQVDSNNWKGVSNNLAQTPVQANIAVRVGSNTRYVILAEDLITKSDFELGRPRTVTGEVYLQLTAGNSFTFNLARGPSMGTMRKSGVTGDLAEVMGLRKTRFVAPGGVPNRDALNFVQVYRLA